MRRQRVGQPLRAAAGDRPADAVRAQCQHEPEGAAGRASAARASSARSSPPAGRGRHRPSKRWRARARAGHSALSPKRAMASGCRGGRRGPRSSLEQRIGVADERLEQPPVRPLVAPQPARRLRHGALEHHRAPSVERVGQRRVGVRPAPARARPAAARSGTARPARGRGRSSRCRARSPAASAPPSDSPPPTVSRALHEADRAPRAGERDARRQPVGAGADDYGVVRQPRGRA